MADQVQSYAAHRRWVPMYHFVASLLLLVNAGWAGWTMIRGFGASTIIQFTTAFALLLLFFYLRVFPLAVQDRLIRLEERLRFQRILPDDLRARTDSLTAAQMVGLRFASDAEAPALVRKVLDENIHNTEAIKKLIKDWRPDHVRA